MKSLLAGKQNISPKYHIYFQTFTENKNCGVALFMFFAWKYVYLPRKRARLIQYGRDYIGMPGVNNLTSLPSGDILLLRSIGAIL